MVRIARIPVFLAQFSVTLDTLARVPISGIRVLSSSIKHVGGKFVGALLAWFNSRNIWVRLVSGIWVILVILWSGMIYWAYVEQKNNAVEQARDFALSVHQMTMASLTGMMITGTVGQRAVYLDQVRNTDNIKALEVIRSEAVKQQFGEGMILERSQTADELAAFSTAQPVFHVDAAAGFLTAAIPAIAKKDYLGKDCLSCHVVKEGEVLGVVSMKISLEHVNANAHEFMMKIGGVALLLSIPFMLFVYLFVTRSVTRPLHTVLDCFEEIGKGNYENSIKIVHEDEIGKVLHDLMDMQSKLKRDVGEARRVANEMLRIKIALDNASTGVMIVDAERSIIYMNRSVQKILKDAEADIREHLPSFRADALMGASIDLFHRDPAHQAHLLGTLQAPHSAALRLGKRHMIVTANPVINDAGERLGSVAEWLDRSAEVEVENEVDGLVQAALAGDFSHRLSTHDKQGFLRQLAGGLNRLSETTQSGLSEVAQMFKAISEGDLSGRIDTDYHGIFGELKDDANGTVARLREVLGRIQSASDAINTAAQEIASGNQDLSSRTEEQAYSLQQTSSSMEMLNNTVRKNAEGAQRANELAGKSNEAATRGGQMVQRVVRTMGDIESGSSRIADIVGVIDGIAFQTNILALNAAVEAARAGAQGRGFAVVATEVRGLAQRSADAAREIKELIFESVRQVEEGAALAQETGATMVEVVSSFRQLASLVTGISSASLEQSASIEQVSKAVGQMDEGTQHNASLVEQAAAAAESLEEQATQLVEAVGMFRLERGHQAGRAVTGLAHEPDLPGSA
jgi:methyl-accepting chemotaxis protein